jgi:hypothetical protein
MALPFALLVAVMLAFLFYRYLIYPAFISPLSKIPVSHPIASVLPIWMWWKERTGCQARSIFDAHQRNGPVVRVGPNEVHLASLDGLRVAFNSGKFERSDWFLAFLNFDGTPNLLTMLDLKRHATRRRMVSRIFSKSYLFDSMDFQMLSQILLFERLMPVFDEAAKTGQGVDVYEMSFAAGVEFMSAYEVGTGNCFDLLRKGREHERKAYLETGKIKVLELKGHKKAANVLEDQTLETCRKAEEFLTSISSANKEKKNKGDGENRETSQVAKERSESASTYPVVYAQLRNSIPEREGAKNLGEIHQLIASEFLDNLEAARVALGITLTYILHELTIRPAIQSDLLEELMTLEPPLSYPAGQNRISTSTLRKLDGLPLLDAVVTETLRVRVSIQLPFRRVVPEGGALIDGYFLPAGVTIASSAYSMHMNPAAYPEPSKWNPKRWLDIQDAAREQVPCKSDQGEVEKGRASNDPRRWFWAFGSGSRMCIGNNFALLGKFSKMHCSGDAKKRQ